MITLNDAPLDMYHKIMLWGDAITPHALELCSMMPMDEIKTIQQKLEAGQIKGFAGKMLLAKTIVADLHGSPAASQAETEFLQLTTKAAKEIDKSILQAVDVSTGASIVDLLISTGLASSRRAARELLNNNAVRIDGVAIDQTWSPSAGVPEVVLQVGKKKLENHRLLRIF